jgi:FkbM family methyltransferase
MFFSFEKFLNKPLPKKPIFFDVGSNRGQWIEKAIANYPNCVIYAFEPMPNITPNYQNVILTNCAVDVNEIENRKFYITADDVTSSLLELNKEVTNGFIDFVDNNGVLHKRSDFDIIKVINVDTIRLDNFINENEINEIHYLKIDTEGNDLNIFKSLGDKYSILWSFEIEVWNEEVTLYKNSAWRDPCIDFIENKGFSVVDQFIHGKGKTTDLLFIRNSLIKD